MDTKRPIVTAASSLGLGGNRDWGEESSPPRPPGYSAPRLALTPEVDSPRKETLERGRAPRGGHREPLPQSAEAPAGRWRQPQRGPLAASTGSTRKSGVPTQKRFRVPGANQDGVPDVDTTQEGRRGGRGAFTISVP